jgi:hypothetical protein
MTCVLCGERKKESHGPSPRCAFIDGLFQKDNFDCATMNKLRTIANSLGTTWRDDQTSGSIGYVPFGGSTQSGNIVMTWNKDRGTTGNAVIMLDSNEPQPLSEENASEAIKWQRKRVVTKQFVFKR